jgi:uncharacterized repeat protein (TIGR03837 family)
MRAMNSPKRQWDIFCRVIDNHGDIGVCWRLARELAARGHAVTLWADDVSALQWMAPEGALGVTVLAWPDSTTASQVGDVVVEAFGCELPEPVVHAMAARPNPPVWVNLEYLSAEPFAQRCHRLASPACTGPGVGLKKWFFYPGFVPGTGGLIREQNLAQRQQHFNSAAWLQSKGLQPHAGEQVVSLFCYEQPELLSFLQHCAQRPTLLLVAYGAATRQVQQWLGPSLQTGGLRARLLPPLTQLDYDHLLWASHLNCVRGEDSFVRAQWAGAPFLWQIYPQHDGVQAIKLNAFLDCFLSQAAPELASAVRECWAAWNGYQAREWMAPSSGPWRQHCAAWREGLLGQPDLATQLISFVAHRP